MKVTRRNISHKDNQAQTTEETTSDPPGIDNTESTELQLNLINCESTDSESDTNNTISVNMITVKNDYEPLIYDQPFSSHIYENRSEFLQDYYARPIRNDVSVEQNVNEINQYDRDQNKQHFFMSDLEFKPIHKFF